MSTAIYVLEQKVRKICIPLGTPVLLHKVEYKGLCITLTRYCDVLDVRFFNHFCSLGQMTGVLRPWVDKEMVDIIHPVLAQMLDMMNMLQGIKI